MCSNGSPGISTLPSTPATKPTSSAPIIPSPPPCAESNHRRAPVSGAAAGTIFQSIRSAWSYVLRAASSVAVSVLLRQPNGFEGLRMVPEHLQEKKPAFAQRADHRPLDVRLRPVACATPHLPHHNPVSRVGEAHRFQCVSVPGLTAVLEHAHNRLPACGRRRPLRPTFQPADDDRVGVV